MILKELYLLSLKKNTKVFHAKTLKTNPKNIILTHSIKNNIVIIESLLLNPGDEFEIQVLSSTSEYPNIDSRIAGITSIKERFPKSKTFINNAIALSLCFFLLINYARSMSLVLFSNEKKSSVFIKIVNGMFSIVSVLSAFYVIDNQFPIESNKILLFSLAFIPIIIGVRLGRIEKNITNS